MSFTEDWILLRGEYTFKGDKSSKLFLLPSEKGSSLKGKNMLTPFRREKNSFLTELEQILSFYVDLGNWGCRKANQMSQKLSLLYKMAEKSTKCIYSPYLHAWQKKNQQMTC